MKQCSKCKKVKEDNDFSRDKTKKSGLSSQCKKCKQVSIDKWNAENKELRREKARANYHTTKDQVLAQKKIYYRANKETISEKNYARKCARLEIDVNFKLRERLRTRMRAALKKNFKVGSAVSDLGCSIESFKKYLELKFQLGMTWENYGKGGWEIDHIKPLSVFDLTDRTQFLEACHFSNLQPLWAVDNMRKGAKYG